MNLLPSMPLDFILKLTGPGFESYFKLFCLAFGFGFGWHAIVSEATQWASAFRAAKKGNSS